MDVRNSIIYRLPEHIAWCDMRKRCYLSTHFRYADYGGRGVGVCERWRHSFEAFYQDMGPRPSASHSLDRIDNNGDYEPGNCRWSTAKEQARNTRRNRMLTFRGQTMCVAAWSEETGININTLYIRIHRGWSIDRVLSKPSEH